MKGRVCGLIQRERPQGDEEGERPGAERLFPGGGGESVFVLLMATSLVGLPRIEANLS